MELHRYRVTGIVQGVGFRPFIHKLASKYGLKGWIYNDSDGVLIEVEGRKNTLKDFANEIKTSHPPMAKIDNILRVSSDKKIGKYKIFEIKESIKFKKTDTLIPPDSNVCDDCLSELFDKSDKRFRYPFINCTNCGPRYSLIKEMPYDRDKTTMRQFKMCTQCNSKYHSIDNRRYHAQPNACPICGPKLELRDNLGNIIENDDIIEFSKKKLLEGKVLGIKSIGGFHLVVDARNDEAIKLLRERKKRDSKPFALMVKDIETAHKYVYLCEQEVQLLKSTQRPIVILKKKNGIIPDSVAPNNPSYGLMLPSAPLHYLLLESESLPVLVMTSGNVSEHPIVYKNEDALQELGSIVDYLILNNRDIHTRIDDSIIRCTNYPQLVNPIISHIRRSRGFAPYPIKIPRNVKPILALGSELKATIALSKNNQVFISQHIGDVKNDNIYNSLIDCSNHIQSLISITPEILACDAHPGFRTRTAAVEQNELPVVLVQHHHAHMASCMAENKIDSIVIGVIFDGNGYGLDGTIWGGEFLIGNYEKFERVGTLRPFSLLGGDKAVKEPFRVAIDLLYRTYEDFFWKLDLDFLKKMNLMENEVYYKMAKNKINAFQTSSMGRLFDGVSALLNICLKIEYEAQAAIELESLLYRDLSISEPFNYEITNINDIFELDYRPMITELVNELNKAGYSTQHLSRRFHSTIVDMIVKMCMNLREKHLITDVVLSGGVFMNEFILINSILALKKQDFNVYYHSLVPTNDGGISLGQIMVAHANGI